MQLLDRLRDRIDTQPDRPASATIPTNDAYSILDNERRRHIVEFLATHDDETIPLRDIADFLAEAMDDDRQTCYVSVLQQHAPRMECAGVVTHDNQAQELHVHASLYSVYTAHKAFQNELD